MSTVLPVGQERPSTQGMQIPFFSLAAFNGTIPQAKSESWKCFRIIVLKEFGFEHPQFHSTHTHARDISSCEKNSVLPLLQSSRKPRSPIAALQSSHQANCHSIQIPSHKKTQVTFLQKTPSSEIFRVFRATIFCPNGNKTESPNLNVPTQATSAHVTSTTRRTTHDVIYIWSYEQRSDPMSALAKSTKPPRCFSQQL